MADQKVPVVGSRIQVFRGHARHTKSGLTKKDLLKNKHGRIVSRKKHAAGLKKIKQLRALGYTAKKGVFRLFRKSDAKKGKRGTRKLRGGSAASFLDLAESGSSGSA